MNFSASIVMDTEGFFAFADDMERRQLPYVISLALNETVKGGRLAVQEEMERVFDRPTPYAKRGVVYDRAEKTRLTAAVVLTGDRTRGGLPATAFLGPQVHGGLRALKAFERQLVDRGHLHDGEVVVPASSAPLNRYGNVTQGLLNRVMADLQIDYRGAGATRARTATSLKRNRNYRKARFFVARRGGHLFPGIYQRIPGKRDLTPLLLFVSAREYQKRLPFFEVVARHANAEFNGHFIKAFDRIKARFAARSSSR